MSDPVSNTAAAVPTWSPTARRIASVLIALHIAAVFVAPFAFACRTPSGASPFADGLMGWFRPYIDLMYLNHGYAFFAPDPGPSHLVRYRITFNDDRPPIEGIFPDLRTQRPRLLYHRHFMISTMLQDLFIPAEPPPEGSLDPELVRTVPDASRRALEAAIRQQHRELLAMWQDRRDRYEALRDSLEQHLKSVHGGSEVTLTRVEHELLDPDAFEVFRRLDAPHTYHNLPEGRPAPEVIRR